MSVAAAFAPSPLVLILTRALLAVFGATIAPSTMGLLRTLFPDEKRMGTAIGVYFACFMGGALVGPLVGGVVLQATWWGGVFLLGVPVMALLLVLGPVLLPPAVPSTSHSRIDFVSTALVLLAVLPAIWGVKELARGHAGLLVALGVMVGLGFGWAFVRRQLRLPVPMLDLRLFRRVPVAFGLGAHLLTGMVMAGSTLLASLHLQDIDGLTPLRAGLWLIPQNVVMVAGFQLAPLLNKRLPTLVVPALGFLIAGIGLALLGLVNPGTGPVLIAVAMSIGSAGVSLPMTVLITLIMSTAPQQRAGSVAAVTEAFPEFGIALGIALLGSLAAAVSALTQAAGGAPQPSFTTGYATAELVAAAVLLLLGTGALLLARRVVMDPEATATHSADSARPQATAVGS